MKRRNKYLLTIPNCPQKRSTANIGKIMIRIFSFVENHETEKKEHKKITINISEGLWEDVQRRMPGRRPTPTKGRESSTTYC